MSDTCITFLSDYGLNDPCVGVCHGVMARFAPGVRVIDLCHAVGRQDITHGATTLAGAIGYLPVATHVAVVEPVSSAGHSRGIAVRTADGSTFVAPDNGLTSLAWAARGSVTAVHEIADESLWLPTPSTVFRGRDVYAPVAARLAAGLELERVGPAIDAASLVTITPRRCEVDSDHVHGEVVEVDHFGNLALNVARSDLEAAGVLLGDQVEIRSAGRDLFVRYAHTYGEVPAGRVVVCEDSLRRVIVAVNQGRAADVLRAGRRDPIVLARVRGGNAPADKLGTVADARHPTP